MVQKGKRRQNGKIHKEKSDRGVLSDDGAQKRAVKVLECREERRYRHSITVGITVLLNYQIP